MKQEIISLLSNCFFLFSIAFLGIHQIIQKVFHFRFTIIDNYGDDFFAMPFILTLFLIEQYFWRRRTTSLSIFEIIIFTLLFGMFFEFLVPEFNQNYITDYWDFLAYSLGSFAFYYLINTKGLRFTVTNN